MPSAFLKNKVAPPFKVAEFDIIYGEGISQEGCLIDLGVEYNIITKSERFVIAVSFLKACDISLASSPT